MTSADRRPRLAASRASVAAGVAFLALALVACGGGATASPDAAATPTAPAASPGLATPTPAGSGGQQPSAASPSPVATPSAIATSAPTTTAAPTGSLPPPSPAAFWAAVSRGLGDAKRLEVTVRGPNPGTLRYEPTASATIVDGAVGFLCKGGVAYDGQSGFAAVPGKWQCGAAALAAGFRTMGQPTDAWNATNPTDTAITESVTSAADGSWTWSYRATSAYYGGPVAASARLVPASGRLLAASRTDPTGDTTYTFAYGAAFAPLAIPH